MRFVFLLLLAVPAYYIWEGAVARKLEFKGEMVHFSVDLVTLDKVRSSHLKWIDDNDPRLSEYRQETKMVLDKYGQETKVLSVSVDNKSAYIIRSVNVQPKFRIEEIGRAPMKHATPCLRDGEAEFRLLAGQSDDQLCIVWLDRFAQRGLLSNRSSWSAEIFGHNQPVVWVVPLLKLWEQLWDKEIGGFRRVNE
jgi:hypothetical protein